LVLAEGDWTGTASIDNAPSDRPVDLSFSVKKIRVAGDAKMPVHFACKVPRAVTSLPGMTVSGAVGLESMHGSSTEDFSKIAHPSGTNSFIASFSVPLSMATYTVVVKGSFLTPISAKGTITVTSSTCKEPTSYAWQASGPADTAPSTDGNGGASDQQNLSASEADALEHLNGILYDIAFSIPRKRRLDSVYLVEISANGFGLRKTLSCQPGGGVLVGDSLVPCGSAVATGGSGYGWMGTKIYPIKEVPLLPDDGLDHDEQGNPTVTSHNALSEPQGTIRVESAKQEAKLISRVDPVYPPLARAARVQGTVVLDAVIGPDGRISNLQVHSGMAMLNRAALDAVRSWVYAPTLVKGKPVPVSTTIEVRFSLP
jgi:TonB family protein